MRAVWVTFAHPVRELVALGRLQGAVPIVTKSAGPLYALVANPAMDAETWRAEVVAACGPIRLAADQGRGVHGLGSHAGWRPVVAALERIGTSAVIAEHAVMHGNEAGLILVIRYRLPRVLQALATALQTLTVTVVKPDALSAAYAC